MLGGFVNAREYYIFVISYMALKMMLQLLQIFKSSKGKYE